LSATTALRQSAPSKLSAAPTNPKTLPIKKARRPTQHLIETHAFARKQKQNSAGAILRALARMWILPPLKLDCFKQSRSVARSDSYVDLSIHQSSRKRCACSPIRARKIDNRRSALVRNWRTRFYSHPFPASPSNQFAPSVIERWTLSVER